MRSVLARLKNRLWKGGITMIGTKQDFFGIGPQYQNLENFVHFFF